MKELFIKNMLLPMAMSCLKIVITSKNIRFVTDKLFDMLEATVKDSKTKFDDKTVIPIVKQLRRAMDV